jgi:antagonist of KipI
MIRPLFKVVKKGLMTSFQDLGRYGYQQYGVVVSGAMDPFAFQLGNILVGNKRNDNAAIEMAMIGPEFIALSSVTIAITGGDLSPKVNDQKAPMWKSFSIHKGDHLTFGKPAKGMYSYLTVNGGFDLPTVMGSKSTYMKAGIGQPIENGDVLYGQGNGTHKAGRGLKVSLIPSYDREVIARVVPGPHCDRFTQEGLHNFYHSTYVVKQADRMGIRLEGSDKIIHRDGADIDSDAIPFGGIQVPANGQPIILMADRQTTGGYTRIGTVIYHDLAKIAQLSPGGSMRFQRISVEKAQALYIEKAKQLHILEQLSME